MRTALAVGVTILVLLGAYLLMWRGWRRRASAQADLPPLPAPLPPSTVRYGPVAGVFVGTTTAGDWLDRIVAHSLGLRSTAELTVTDAGVTIERDPEPALSIPAGALRAVRVDRAAAGRAVRSGEYLILTWSHGDRLLDSAVRPDRRAELNPLHDAIAPLVTAEAGA